jgi:hypothetical protein
MQCQDCGTLLRPLARKVNGALKSAGFAPCPRCAAQRKGQERLFRSTLVAPQSPSSALVKPPVITQPKPTQAPKPGRLPLVHCSVCQVAVRADRLGQHKQRVHPGPRSMAPSGHMTTTAETVVVLAGSPKTADQSNNARCQLCRRRMPAALFTDHMRSHELSGQFEDVSTRPGHPSGSLHCFLCFKKLGQVRYRQTALLYQCVDCHYKEQQRRDREKAECSNSRPPQSKQKQTKRKHRPVGRNVNGILQAGPVPPRNHDRVTTGKRYVRVYQGGRVSLR